jgi:hypothetical protein
MGHGAATLIAQQPIAARADQRNVDAYVRDSVGAWRHEFAADDGPVAMP